MTPANGRETVAIIGTGLMGGSFGLAARKRGLTDRVIGFDRSGGELQAAHAMGAVTEIAPSAGAAAAEASLVVIATPVGTIATVFGEIAAALRPEAIVTDVGSTKHAIVSEVVPLVPPHAHFVGGHPIAGSEHQGVEAADPDLFEGHFWILTPTEHTDAAAYGRLVRFLNGLDVHVLSLEPARHDELLALTSHLPQLIASTLMRFASDLSAAEGGLPLVTAGGFRDMTRIAASSPDLWIDIVRQNRAAVAEVLARFQSALREAASYLTGEDWEGLRATLTAAREARTALPGKPGLVPEALVELSVPVPDRPGVLAELTTTMGEAGINIEDLDIFHSPEGGRGTIYLTVDGEEAAGRAIVALRRKGFHAERISS
ncbi:MAG: prephenate dehydrogenase/arogenate dehydrogenase family protein [Actinomycetota bacterium]